MMGYDLATGEKVDMTQVAQDTAGQRKPYVPEDQGSKQEPIALPGVATSTATSSPLRTADSSGGTGNGNGEAGL